MFFLLGREEQDLTAFPTPRLALEPLGVQPAVLSPSWRVEASAASQQGYFQTSLSARLSS